MRYVTSVERAGIRKGIEQGIEQGIEKGLKEGIKKSVLRLRDKLRLEAEQISDVLEVPLDTVRRYIEQNEASSGSPQT